jgi:hypothetical protein
MFFAITQETAEPAETNVEAIFGADFVLQVGR